MPHYPTYVRVSCSHCHTVCTLAPSGGFTECPTCLHDASVARMRCACRRCQEGPGALTQRAVDELARWFAERLRETEGQP